MREATPPRLFILLRPLIPLLPLIPLILLRLLLLDPPDLSDFCAEFTLSKLVPLFGLRIFLTCQSIYFWANRFSIFMLPERIPVESPPTELPVSLLGQSIWLLSGFRFSFRPWFSLSFVDPRERPPSFKPELLESNDFQSSKAEF